MAGEVRNISPDDARDHSWSSTARCCHRRASAGGQEAPVVVFSLAGGESAILVHLSGDIMDISELLACHLSDGHCHLDLVPLAFRGTSTHSPADHGASLCHQMSSLVRLCKTGEQ